MMNVLRKLAVSLAIALASAPALASENPAVNGGWNTQYGMLFSLQNVFTRQTILDGYAGGVGVQYNLGPQKGLRLAFDVGRTSNPAFEEESTFRDVDGTTVTTRDFNTGGGACSFSGMTGCTSTLNLGVSGTYLVRLTKNALAPYLGAGASIGYASDKRAYEDDITFPNTTLEVNDVARTFSIGLMGNLGLEWRVHKSLSMFAEYGLGVTAFSMTSGDESQKVTTPAGTTEDATSFSQTRFFNFNSGLVQGGSLGIIAFF
jgi:outer membrane protein W